MQHNPPVQSRLVAAAAQFDIHLLDPAYNIDTICRLAREAHQELHADLVVFPEAAVAGYCFSSVAEVAQAAIRSDGPEIQRLKELAHQLQLSLVFGTVEQDGGPFYNTAFFLEPDGTLHRYRKVHLPLLGLDKYVTGGNEFAVSDTRFGKVGLIICYDLRFPEPFRQLALQGARLIIQPTNLPVGGESHLDFLGRARACENRVYLISCNRCGEERGFRFIGRSQIVDLGGQVLCEAGSGEQTICASLDLSRSEQKDIIVIPNEYETHIFSDRRPELYTCLTQPTDQWGFVKP